MFAQAASRPFSTASTAASAASREGYVVTTSRIGPTARAGSSG
jgi:hypothetical protein